MLIPSAVGDPTGDVLLEMMDMRQLYEPEGLLYKSEFQQINLGENGAVLAVCALHCCTPCFKSWLKLIGKTVGAPNKYWQSCVSCAKSV